MNKQAKCGSVDVSESHALSCSFFHVAFESGLEVWRMLTSEVLMNDEAFLDIFSINDKGDEAWWCPENA